MARNLGRKILNSDRKTVGWWYLTPRQFRFRWDMRSPVCAVPWFRSVLLADTEVHVGICPKENMICSMICLIDMLWFVLFDILICYMLNIPFWLLPSSVVIDSGQLIITYFCWKAWFSSVCWCNSIIVHNYHLICWFYSLTAFLLLTSTWCLLRRCTH